jgi:hypothetical protein
MGGLALLTPYGAPSVTGNAVTVERVARGLLERGTDLRVWDLSRDPAATIEAEVEAYRPALVHGFHAWRIGPLALRLARRLEVPLVVTLTGTDANHDLFDPERAPLVRHVLEAAAVITAFHPSIIERVASILPDVRARMAIVPQAVLFAAAEPFHLAAHWALPPDRVLVLFPAGIRAVKDPRRPLSALDDLAAADPRLRLAYAGPILDAALGRALLADVAARPWTRYLGAVPHGQMASLIGQSDVVLWPWAARCSPPTSPATAASSRMMSPACSSPTHGRSRRRPRGWWRTPTSVRGSGGRGARSSSGNIRPLGSWTDI